jgi:uncharacterized protein
MFYVVFAALKECIMEKDAFSLAVIEKSKCYVYLLVDPETEEVFYVGKGTGNRIFAHLNDASQGADESAKLERIRAIQQRGMQVKCIIHRHGLTEDQAFEVEAALIDFIGLSELTNQVAGQHSTNRGPMSILEVQALYDAPKIDIKEPVILITVNRQYHYGISPERLYEITRCSWKVSEHRNKAQYAFSIYHGVVRQVYEIRQWEQAESGRRWCFSGHVANELQHYVGGSIADYSSVVFS